MIKYRQEYSQDLIDKRAETYWAGCDRGIYMRIVICDDEPLARERLVRIVQESGHEVVAQATTGNEAVSVVKAKQPDVILLDIRMPEMDGVRCAQALNELEHPPAVIFVTAYDHYAIAAFKANAIGYLLKPANKDSDKLKSGFI